jgi:hypothetical protein
VRRRRKRAANALSRFRLGRSGDKAGADAGVDAGPFRHDSAALAEEIGVAALALAKRANAAGLTALGFLLESVALEAGAQSVTRRWPSDTAEP